MTQKRRNVSTAIGCMWDGRATHQIGCALSISFMLKEVSDDAFASAAEISHRMSTPPMGVAAICGLAIGAARIATSSKPTSSRRRMSTVSPTSSS